ncbi:hypothetical protein [Natrinema salifodinae]|uniref:hypothetical protein n=1 Tax=Natrinema salifodinae TaxID=1202768 RepID=UPI0011609340|nr:hypothetical protein [Natrinema salifodinae]
MSGKTKTVGLKMDDGSYEVLPEGMAGSRENVSQIILPASIPWESDVQLYPAELEFAGSEERAMGGETIYDARHIGTVPNTGDEFYVEATFQEYPANDFQLVDGGATGPASFAHFAPDDLKSYMYAVL